METRSFGDLQEHGICPQAVTLGGGSGQGKPATRIPEEFPGISKAGGTGPACAASMAVTLVGCMHFTTSVFWNVV